MLHVIRPLTRPRLRRCSPLLALLTGLLLTAARPAAAQWILQNTNFPAVSTGVGQIEVVDASTAWVTGFDGSGAGTARRNFSRTTDGGTTWVVGTVAPATGLGWANLAATSSSTAWAALVNVAAGGGQLYTTTDGGTTWSRQLATAFPVAAGGFLDAVRMFSATTGIVLGDPLTTTGEFEVYTTTTGGTTWTAVPAAALPNPLAGEYGFLEVLTTQGTANAWFGTNKGRVYRSVTGGTAWTVAATGLPQVDHLAFSSAISGLAMALDTAGRFVALRRTTDGGATWTAVAPTGPLYTSDLQAVPGAPDTFVSAGARLNNNGSSVSTDGGLTWTALETNVQRTAIGAASGAAVWAGSYTDVSNLGGIVKGRLPATAVPATLNWQWAQPAGSATDDAALRVATDAAGNAYVAGRYRGTLTLGAATLTSAGGDDIYLAKYDAQGTLLWARSAGGPDTDFPGAVVIDPVTGAVVVAGSFGGTAMFGGFTVSSLGGFDGFVATYSAGGVPQAAVSIGSTGADFAHDVVLDAVGNAYLAGEFSDTLYLNGDLTTVLLTSQGGTDAFVLALSPQTDVTWASKLGGPLADAATGVAFTPNGTLYLTGRFRGVATVGGGAAALTSAGDNDLFLSTYDAGSGTAQWAHRLGGTADDGGRAVAVDAAGAAYVTGYFTGSFAAGTVPVSTLTSAGATDVLVAKYALGGSGTLQWARSGGGAGTDSGYGIATDADGTTTVAGFVTGAATFGTMALAGAAQDGFLVRYATTGTLLDADAVGGAGQDVLSGIALDAAGNTYVAGAFGGSIALGAAGTFSSVGGTDGLLAKLGAPCTLTTPTVTVSADTLCAGQTLTLTATNVPAGTTGEWTGPTGFSATTNPAIISGATSAASGAYTFTATLGASGCSVSATTTAVTVNDVPADPVPVAVFARCGPGPLTLTVTSAGATAYAWYPTATGSAALAGATGAGYATPALTTTTTYYVSATNAGGCSSARVPVRATIDSIPTVTLTAGGPTAFCAGGGVLLTAGGTADSTASIRYDFLLNGQSIAGMAVNPTVGVGLPGIYTVVATTAAGCQATSAPVTLTVLPAVSAAFAYPTATLCTGGAGALPTVSGTVGGTFRVVPATGLLVDSVTGALSLSGAAAGTYTVTYAVGGPCPDSAAQLLTLTAPPVAPVISLTPVGGLTQLTSSAAANNQWYLNGAPIGGATGTTYTITAAAQNGVYTVVTTGGGCPSASSAGQSVSITGISADATAADAKMHLYPNPTTDGRLTVVLPAALAPGTHITVFDGAGRVVLSVALPASATRYALDIQYLPAGLYAVRVGGAVRRLVRR